MNKNFTYIFGLLFLITAFQNRIFAQYQTKSLSWNTKAYESLTYNGPEGSMPYRLLKPVGYNPAIKYPLVIMLHGRGEGISSCGDPNCVLVWGGKMHLDSIAKRPSFIVFPRTHGGDWSTAPLNRVIGIMRLLTQTYSIDLDRVYIHGLSAGGQGVWNIGINHPNYFAAISPHSAAGNSKYASNVEFTPIWSVQGANDGSPSPNSSIQMFNQLQKLGKHPIMTYNPTTKKQTWPSPNTTEPIYTLAPGVGHEAWPVLYNSHGWLAWLYAQKQSHIIAIGGTQVGAGKSVTLGIAQGFLGYEWSNGANTNQIKVTTPGTYKVRYKRYAYISSGPQVWSNWSDPITITGAAVVAHALLLNTTAAVASEASITNTNNTTLLGIRAESSPTFTLINADNGKDLFKVKSGDTINLGELPTQNLNIRANIDNVNVKSVEFNFDGKIIRESKAPYSLFGDVNGKFSGGKFSTEQHILLLNTYDSDTGTIASGKSVLEFTVIDQPPPVIPNKTYITSFTLIDADKDKGLFDIKNGDTIYLSKLPTQNLNIRANTNGETMDVVEFKFDGTSSAESQAPYALFGDVNGNYNGKKLSPGQHTLIAYPYTKAGTGGANITTTIKFTVLSKAPSAPILLAKTIAEPILVNLYPNPIEDRIYVNFSEEQSNVIVNIYDKFGNLIKTLSIIHVDDKTVEADISSLSLKPDVYVIKINSDKIKDQTFQVLKNY